MSKPANLSPISIGEYDYALPDERIAKYPLQQRDASKLLVYKGGKISESIFRNAAEFLPPDCLLVYNNTRVIRARMVFRKETGARIEIFCLEPAHPADYALSLGATGKCSWNCLIGNLKKWKEGSLIRELQLDGRRVQLRATRLEQGDGNELPQQGDNRNISSHPILFEWDDDSLCFADLLEKSGELPIPPYLNRDTEESDLDTYQTVYSKIKGSVAAPTAGLHFTGEVLNDLRSRNITTEELTLHVGAGTFQPVKTDDVADHEMHSEVISVRRSTLVNLIQHLGNIIAVGTTSVRTLESLYYLGVQLHEKEKQNELTPTSVLTVAQWDPYLTNSSLSTHEALHAILSYLDRNHLSGLQAQTQIMIRPGFQFRIIRGMFTNFHQPKSTLLLLVSAFTGAHWKTIYAYALANDFRFLSYGDSSLLLT